MNKFYNSIYKHGDYYLNNTKKELDIFIEEQSIQENKSTLSKYLSELFLKYNEYINQLSFILR